MNKINYVIGIDPGIGVKSPTGLAIIDINEYSIALLRDIWPETKDKFKRYGELAYLYNKAKNTVSKKPFDYLLCCEYFVMRAKSGESLQRLVGAYYATSYDAADFVEIQNVKVKQYIGASGDASKKEVAKGVANWFEKKNTDSYKKVTKLIKEEKWDQLDALAIAISGYLKYVK